MSNRRKIKPSGRKFPLPRDRSVEITMAPVDADGQPDWSRSVDLSRSVRNPEFTLGGRAA